jgi:hypothetical protein
LTFGKQAANLDDDKLRKLMLAKALSSLREKLWRIPSPSRVGYPDQNPERM